MGLIGIGVIKGLGFGFRVQGWFVSFVFLCDYIIFGDICSKCPVSVCVCVCACIVRLSSDGYDFRSWCSLSGLRCTGRHNY